MLGGFEHLVLGATVRLKDEETGCSYASGVSVLKEIQELTGHRKSVSAVYTTLERLEKKAFLRSEVSDRVASRPMRFYYPTDIGLRALAESGQAIKSMWAGLL